MAFFYRMLLAMFVVSLMGRSADAQPCVVQQIAKLLTDDGAASDLFGDSVAISGATAIVGTPGAGAAYLFDTATDQQIAKLLTNDGALIGPSVAISGTTAIAGGSLAGDRRAYLFDVLTGEQIAKLVPDDPQLGTHFGFSVAISGDIAIIGNHTGDGRGSAYLFDVFTGQQITNFWPTQPLSTGKCDSTDPLMNRRVPKDKRFVLPGIEIPAISAWLLEASQRR